MRNIETLIDDKLKEIYSSEIYILKGENDFKNFDEYTEYRKLIFVILKNDLNLINNKFGQDDSISLSARGREICEKGGWIKHKRQLKLKRDKENQKFEYDFKISKLKSKTFFPALILGVIGGIYSLIKIIIFIINAL